MQGYDTCPKTGKRLSGSSLEPNGALNFRVQAWMEKVGELQQRALLSAPSATLFSIAEDANEASSGLNATGGKGGAVSGGIAAAGVRNSVTRGTTAAGRGSGGGSDRKSSDNSSSGSSGKTNSSVATNAAVPPRQRRAPPGYLIPANPSGDAPPQDPSAASLRRPPKGSAAAPLLHLLRRPSDELKQQPVEENPQAPAARQPASKAPFHLGASAASDGAAPASKPSKAAAATKPEGPAAAGLPAPGVDSPSVPQHAPAPNKPWWQRPRSQGTSGSVTAPSQQHASTPPAGGDELTPKPATPQDAPDQKQPAYSVTSATNDATAAAVAHKAAEPASPQRTRRWRRLSAHKPAVDAPEQPPKPLVYAAPLTSAAAQPADAGQLPPEDQPAAGSGSQEAALPAEPAARAPAAAASRSVVAGAASSADRQAGGDGASPTKQAAAAANAWKVATPPAAAPPAHRWAVAQTQYVGRSIDFVKVGRDGRRPEHVDKPDPTAADLAAMKALAEAAAAPAKHSPPPRQQPDIAAETPLADAGQLPPPDELEASMPLAAAIAQPVAAAQAPPPSPSPPAGWSSVSDKKAAPAGLLQQQPQLHTVTSLWKPPQRSTAAASQAPKQQTAEQQEVPATAPSAAEAAGTMLLPETKEPQLYTVLDPANEAPASAKAVEADDEPPPVYLPVPQHTSQSPPPYEHHSYR